MSDSAAQPFQACSL